MNNPKQILWIDANSTPPHNYLWQKEDGIYTFINDNWIRTKVFSDIEPECNEVQTNVSKLTNGEYYTIDELPRATVGCNYGWVKERNGLYPDLSQPYIRYTERDEEGNIKSIYYHTVFE